VGSVHADLCADLRGSALTANLDVMAEIAQPLDDWCEFCGMKLATMRTADGVGACASCAAEVLEAMAKYETEMQEAAHQAVHGSRNPRSARQAKAKAKRRAKRRRTGR